MSRPLAPGFKTLASSANGVQGDKSKFRVWLWEAIYHSRFPQAGRWHESPATSTPGRSKPAADRQSPHASHIPLKSKIRFAQRKAHNT